VKVDVCVGTHIELVLLLGFLVCASDGLPDTYMKQHTFFYTTPFSFANFTDFVVLILC